MRRYVTFASVDKSPLNVSVPTKLAKGFRERAKESRLKSNELLTYMLCDLLGEDPVDFGLFPLLDDRGGEAGADRVSDQPSV